MQIQSASSAQVAQNPTSYFSPEVSRLARRVALVVALLFLALASFNFLPPEQALGVFLFVATLLFAIPKVAHAVQRFLFPPQKEPLPVTPSPLAPSGGASVPPRPPTPYPASTLQANGTSTPSPHQPLLAPSRPVKKSRLVTPELSYASVTRGKPSSATALLLKNNLSRSPFPSVDDVD